ncbi:unnamed protein product [Lymnaea stagnalis]|uniref:RanBP2-type domain-containing protein n=1 Tax=Lymnaea stagnalis TaxID=6523 RepID=A0AAV2H3T1_LYMST
MCLVRFYTAGTACILTQKGSRLKSFSTMEQGIQEQSIINQARRLYIKLHTHQASLTDVDKEQLNGSINTFINIAVKETPAKNLVTNPFLLSILKTSIKLLSLESDDVMPIARAFASLERYFLLLVEQPWKPEFRKIKMYGGFYRTRIKSVVHDCEQIFHRAGYAMSMDNTVMTYQGKMDNKLPLLLLAFDCKIGFVQCQIIGEYYSKVKGINMSLMDAMYNILRDESHAMPNMSRGEWTRPYGSSSPLNFVNGNLTGVTAGFKNLEMGPPAIPKREPISNGSSTLPPRIKYEAEMLLDEDAIFAPPMDRLGLQGVQKLPNKSSGVQGKLPLVSGVVIDENFVEIIPELPQGTSDQHIMESLRVLEQRKTHQPNISALIGQNTFSSQPKVEQWLGHEGKYVQGPVGHLAKFPNTVTSVPNYQGHQRSRLGSTSQSESYDDEGIDISSFSRLYQTNPASARYPSMNQAAGITNRSGANYNPSLIDQGYKTGPSSDPMFHYPPNSAPTPQTVIYHAPSIGQDNGTGVGYMMNTNMRQATGPPNPGPPPPVPSRALKPNLSFRAPQKDSDFHDAITSSSLAKSQSGIIIGRSLNGSGGLGVQSPTTEPILRRDKLGVSKSSSLRYSDDKDSAYQQAIYLRAARSMDISLLQWECKACTALNKASDTVCSMCSHSRHGPEATYPECGKTKKACAKCTYENEPSRTACEVCGGALQDRSTYV